MALDPHMVWILFPWMLGWVLSSHPCCKPHPSLFIAHQSDCLIPGTSLFNWKVLCPPPISAGLFRTIQGSERHPISGGWHPSCIPASTSILHHVPSLVCGLDSFSWGYLVHTCVYLLLPVVLHPCPAHQLGRRRGPACLGPQRALGLRSELGMPLPD